MDTKFWRVTPRCAVEMQSALLGITIKVVAPLCEKLSLQISRLPYFLLRTPFRLPEGVLLVYRAESVPRRAWSGNVTCVDTTRMTFEWLPILNQTAGGLKLEELVSIHLSVHLT